MNVARVRQILLGIILFVLGAVTLIHLSFEALNIVVAVLAIIDGILWMFWG